MSIILAAFALSMQAGVAEPFQDYPIDRGAFASLQGVPSEAMGAIVRPFTECVRSGTRQHVVEPNERGNAAAARAFVVQQSTRCGYSDTKRTLTAFLLQNGVPTEEAADHAATASLNLSVVAGGGTVRDLFGLNPVVRATIPRPCPDGSYTPGCPAKK
jgi:hypothetical protein